jgi:hypothetical protein
MVQLINLIGQFDFKEYNKRKGGIIGSYVRECGCEAIETIFDGTENLCAAQNDIVIGYHLIFYPDWLDFWNGDIKKLNRKFGSPSAWETFYGGKGRSTLISQFHADLLRAELLGVRYVVFHVSDVSIEEGYSYRWEHTNEEVIDASIELINLLLEGQGYSFEFLIENVQWPGFTFTKPRMTERLLSGIRYKPKGIMLDIGHLMCTDLDLKDQEEGCRYVHRMLDEHGDLARYIRGVHLHQSVTGEYVKKSFRKRHSLKEDYLERYAQSYAHIGKIDTHQPFTSAAVKPLIERIAPEYLVHEINGRSLGEKKALILTQQKALRGEHSE